MDYSTVMATKLFKYFGILLLLFTMTACPDEYDCSDMASTVRVENLVIIQPLKETYSQGDTIVFKAQIPAMNIYYGEVLNLFEITGDYNALVTFTDYAPFEDNELIFIKGFQSEFPNWFEVPYNPESGMYELEIEVKLINMGDYMVHSEAYFEFQGEDYCNRYVIDTNIKGAIDGEINFTVQ